MSEDFIDSLIENWVRWHRRALYGLRVRCVSIEHRYRSPQRNHWPDDAPPLDIRVVDVIAAQDTEEAWRMLEFVPKMILKWHYVFRRRKGSICRSLRQKKHGIEERFYDIELQRARLLLVRAFDELKKKLYDRGRTVVCAYVAPVGGAALL